MKRVTRYEAHDGSQFKTASEAKAHEQLIAAVAELSKLLRPVPDDADFANGHGYVQQDEKQVQAYKRGLLLLAKGYGPRFAEGAKTPDDVNPCGVVGRILDDVGGPINTAWRRLMNMDIHYREWGQGYFALNPDKGELICVVGPEVR